MSDISSDATLGSEVIKANTTFCGATKLVILLTMSTLVSAFAVDAILKVNVDKLFGTTAKGSDRWPVILSLILQTAFRLPLPSRNSTF